MKIRIFLVILLLLPIVYFGFMHFVAPWLFVNTSEDVEISRRIHDEVGRQVDLVQRETEGSVRIQRLRVYPAFYNKIVVDLVVSEGLDAEGEKYIEDALDSYSKTLGGKPRSLNINISSVSAGKEVK